jgi:superfamily II DNA/RNA helicase
LIANKDEPDQFAKEPLSPDNMEQEVWQDHMLSEEIGAARYKAFKKMVAILEEEKKDNKWECCKKLINSHAFGKTASAVILTEYSDTAEYVGYLAKDLGINTALIARKTTLTEQHRILDNARITPTLLVGTSAIIEQNLAFTNHLIHYDMPRSPEALLQRFAAIQTIGSRHKYFEHYFLVGRLKTDNDRLKQLMKGVQKLERE